MHLLAGGLVILISFVASGAYTAISKEVAAQKSFLSSQQTVSALIKAVRDNNDTELLSILGPGSEDLISSGDAVADQNARERFLKAFDKKNNLNYENDERAVLLIGDKDYPFPIPIVRQGDVWFFDTQEGLEEILSRRIGRNELHTIEVMQAYTDAQREYACIKRTGGTPEFAQKFSSSAGKKNGLFWGAGEGEEISPFGPLIARATEEGYDGDLDADPPEPFHGYYFKILKSQGEHAHGGAFDYVVDGKMILGFALVAYPAKYGNSGIMTFIVNQEGVIYEKDLGEATGVVAPTIIIFDPDETWKMYTEDTAFDAPP
jgi:hypothetical protein